MDNFQAFGVALRSYRQARALSQEALAEAADLHPTYISMLERAVKRPSLATVIVLAKALGISASDLVKEMERLTAPKRRSPTHK